jgi:hypothetical protein
MEFNRRYYYLRYLRDAVYRSQCIADIISFKQLAIVLYAMAPPDLGIMTCDVSMGVEVNNYGLWNRGGDSSTGRYESSTERN